MSAAKTLTLKIDGMTCVACKNKLEKNLRAAKGVKTAAVNFAAQTANIAYDAQIISAPEIVAIIEKSGYAAFAAAGPKTGAAAGLLIIIAALHLAFEHFGVLSMFSPGALADANMGRGMLFVIGLTASAHCAAMCGGINLSQCVPRTGGAEKNKRAVLKPALFYNAGRVVSYAATGFIAGVLGSALSVPFAAQGALKLIAGVFMLVMGVNMLGALPRLRALSPPALKIFADITGGGKLSGKGPLAVGLLNGLMPCGPLQAMQIYALSTGSPFEGALSMFLFGLGTVPLVFGLGAAAGALGKAFSKNVLTAGAVLISALGLSMLAQGLRLVGFAQSAPEAYSERQIQTENGFQVINSTLSSGGYPNITVKAGTPVKWVINAPEKNINGCNNTLLIAEYGIKYSFAPGENVIEFMPEKAGKFQYTCLMGMLKATITVVE